MQKRLTALALCAVAALAHAAGATTYYVRATGGKDTNAGTTVAAPFKTVAKAIAVAQPGDTVYVAPGAYSAALATARAGTAGSPIRFVADSTGAVFGVKKGTVALRNKTGTALSILHSYVRFEGFAVNTNAMGIRVEGATGVVLLSLDISGSTGDGLRVVNSTVTMTSCKSRSCGSDGVEIGDAGNVTITGGSLYSNVGMGVRQFGIGASVRLSQVLVYSNTGGGIEVANGASNLTNCLIRNNTLDGVLVGPGATASTTLWHCTLARNTNDGIEIRGGSGTIRNSILAYNQGAGMRVAAGATASHTFNLLFSNTLAAFVGTAMATGEIQSNPLFSSATTYTLKNTSPALNAGMVASAITSIDFTGAARPAGGGWDLGCYEGAAKVLFTNVTSTTAFGAVTGIVESDASGLNWVDIDNDGDLDCIATGSAARLMTNNALKTFTTSTLGAVRGQGVILDATGDGRPDFFSPAIGDANTEGLYVNTAGRLLTADPAGMGSGLSNGAAAAVDIDFDGWMDTLMLSGNGNWVGTNTRATPPLFSAEKPSWLNPISAVGSTRLCATGDLNGDLRPDILSTFNTGGLFLSDGVGGYVLQSDQYMPISQRATAPAGAAFADYNNDGDLDFFAADGSTVATGFLLRQEAGSWVQAATEAGLDPGTTQRGCAWGDFDNDGLIDLYICTKAGGNRLWRNVGGGSFVPTGLGAEVDVNAMDAVFVDYDNDGDLDLAVTRIDGGMILLKNGTTVRNYLKVRVIGAGQGGSNTLGIGVRVDLLSATGTFLQRRDVGGARGLGTEPLWVHFGGVDPNTDYQVKVYFASGTRTYTVRPSLASTKIGSRTIAKMATFTEPPVGPPLRITRWREVSPEE